MASALAIDAMMEGAARAPSLGHTGVYRLATAYGRRATGISGMLFLREDRACVLRLVVPTDGDGRIVRLLRGIWWPVEVGIRVLTSDGCAGIWPARQHSVTVSLPLPPCGGTAEGEPLTMRFVRLR
jgi:hypothetical protein